MKSVVVIPTYNEIDTLPLTLERVRQAVPQTHVLVVDDASPDGTGAFATEQARTDTHVHVLHRAGKAGLGPAYLAGFSWAMASGYDLVVEMDADGSHRAEDLALLLERACMADAPDVVIGSRWVSGAHTDGWDAKRVALSRAGNLYINVMLGLGVRDATAGFRVYRTSMLRRMDLGKVEAMGYGFQVNMTMLVARLGGRIVEMPITFVEREAGESKLSRGIVSEELALVTKWGVLTRGRQAYDIMQRLQQRRQARRTRRKTTADA